MIVFTILGEAASKANSRRIVAIGGKPRSIKSAKALNYEQSAILQIPAAAKVMMKGSLRVTMHIFYASERPDLDESVILDVMQAKFLGTGKARIVVRRGVYENDRQVRERHIYHGIDKANPRAEIIVEPI